MPSAAAALGPYDGLGVGFALLFTAAVVVALAVFALIVTVLVRNLVVLGRAGISPFTLQSRVALRYLNGPGSASLEDRLGELDRLREQGTISADERSGARARLLGGS